MPNHAPVPVDLDVGPLKHETTTRSIWCPRCGRDTTHHLTETYLRDGTHAGQTVRCHECPIED